MRFFTLFSLFALLLTSAANAAVFGVFSGTGKATSLALDSSAITSDNTTVTIERQVLDDKVYVSVLIDWRGFAWADRFLLDGENLLSLDGVVVGQLAENSLTVRVSRIADENRTMKLYYLKKSPGSDFYDFRFQTSRASSAKLFAFSLIADIR